MAEILVTNDDGVHSEGIISLATALSSLGRVTTVAPAREMSATSQSLTLHHPIRYQELGPGRYSVEGTPTDCVILALHHILPSRPDIVVSGINTGPNLGRDIGYSGTVAGAVEAANHDIPAFAISLGARNHLRYKEAALFAASLAERILNEPLPAGTILNVNVPPGEIKGVRITCQGHRNIRNLVVESRDPRGRNYYWFDQELSIAESERDSALDYAAGAAGLVSITPLKIDRTGFDVAETIAHWPGALFKEKISLSQ